MGRIEGVRMVELEYESRLLRMGCDSLLITCVDLLEVGKPILEQNGLPWEHSVKNQLGVGVEEIESLIL